MNQYDHKKVEAKWVKAWDKAGIFNADDKSKKPKWYSLIEFPYPSGSGLHVGHIRSNTAMDIISRKRRMEGFNVLYPIGWDAFGLPTENYAIKTGIAPQVATKKNTDTFRKQLKALGFSFDWSREIDTTDPDYYKWTQWMFLQFFKHGLAYKAKAEINWCPKDKIGLANEEVEGGKCERCGGPVEKRLKEQWMLKMTAYAEKLLTGLKGLDFIPEVTAQQENWIGKSEGAEISFRIAEGVKRFVLLHGKGGSPKDGPFPWLKAELEKRGFEVQVPNLPNADEPNDEVQADFVQKNCVLDGDTAVLGHSFGGIVAMRLLERGAQLKRVVLAGTPSTDNFLDGKARPTVSTAIKKGFQVDVIGKNAQTIVLLYDLTDKVVPVSDGGLLGKTLGISMRPISANAPHFTSSEEPALLSALIPALKVFTTRPDTIYGATFLVIAPEHQRLLKALSDPRALLKNKEDVRDYIEITKKKTDIERTSDTKEKTGVELKGLRVVNPATNEEIPVWASDYVLANYGTGIIMAVPQHDGRDRAFAEKFKLPIIDKPLVSFEEALKVSGGVKKIQYKLRDWVFSRQRYWGEPIPLVHCEKDGWVPVPEKDLPVKLPKVEKYQPTDTGESPLSKVEKWIKTKCPTCKGIARRETDTMPNWAGSSWYFLRYIDAHNQERFASREKLAHWMPVDWYNGGMEHATRHLLYARFWNQFFHDIGEVPMSEPFKKRTAHGIILASDGKKMSKSLGNVVNPDELVKEFGADALRVYEMFIGPFDQAVSWDPRGILGAERFLMKIWNLEISENLKVARLMQKTIKKVSEDIEKMSFNTAISAMMMFVNECNGKIGNDDFIRLLKILAPFAPFMSEELWSKLGHSTSIHQEPWPQYDAKLLEEETFELIVQVNGKVRGKVTAPKNISEQEAVKLAMTSADVKRWATGDPKKTVFVPNRLINLIF